MIENHDPIMDLDIGKIIENSLLELILLMAKVIRIAGDHLSEIHFLTGMAEAGKEVITPIHETGTGREIEASLALRKAREENLLKTTQVSGHDPSKPFTLVFRTRISNRAQVSLPMNRSRECHSHSIAFRLHLT